MVKIYVGKSPNLEHIISADFNYKQHVYNPDTVSFKSTKYLKNGIDIRVLGNFPDFGGKINHANIDNDIYSYEVIDYSDLLRGKVKQSFSKKPSSTILKTVLKDRNVKTGGIKKTKKKHKQLIFKDVKAIDVCHQVANLTKNYEFYVNSNGIGVFKKVKANKGLVFRPGSYQDYSTSIDTSNIITAVKVYGKKNASKLLYSYKNKSLSAKYGVITDLIIDDKITTKAKAKSKAKALFKKDSKSEIEASITIPALAEYKKLKPGDWVVVYDKKGNMKSLFVEEITNTATTRQLKLMSSKTPVPDSWKYKKTNEKVSSSSTSTSKTVSVKGVHKDIVAKAQSLGTACKIFKFVANGISYDFYWDNRHSAISTMRRKKANCADQSRLLIDMLKCIGIIGTRKHTSCPCRNGRCGHYNVSAKVNGRVRILDPVSSYPANKHAGAWVRNSSC